MPTKSRPKLYQAGPQEILESSVNTDSVVVGGGGEEAAEGTGESEYLVLVLNDNIGGAGRMVHYKIRSTTQLGKLMRFHCGMMGQTL